MTTPKGGRNPLGHNPLYHQGHAPTPSELLRRSRRRGVAANPTTSPGSWYMVETEPAGLQPRLDVNETRSETSDGCLSVSGRCAQGRTSYLTGPRLHTFTGPSLPPSVPSSPIPSLSLPYSSPFRYTPLPPPSP